MALTPKKKKISGTKKKDKIVWQNKKPWKSALTVNANSGNDSIDFRKSNYAKNKLNGQNGNDTIRGGKKADIILIDTNSANMVPDSSTLTSNIIYSANGSNVDTTICNGKILMENKKLTVLDEQEIYDKAREAIKNLKEAI